MSKNLEISLYIIFLFLDILSIILAILIIYSVNNREASYAKIENCADSKNSENKKKIITFVLNANDLENLYDDNADIILYNIYNKYTFYNICNKLKNKNTSFNEGSSYQTDICMTQRIAEKMINILGGRNKVMYFVYTDIKDYQRKALYCSEEGKCVNSLSEIQMHENKFHEIRIESIFSIGRIDTILSV